MEIRILSHTDILLRNKNVVIDKDSEEDFGRVICEKFGVDYPSDEEWEGMREPVDLTSELPLLVLIGDSMFITKDILEIILLIDSDLASHPFICIYEMENFQEITDFVTSYYGGSI